MANHNTLRRAPGIAQRIRVKEEEDRKMINQKPLKQLETTTNTFEETKVDRVAEDEQIKLFDQSFAKIIENAFLEVLSIIF